MIGTSPRQIPVHIFMSLANKYPCIFAVTWTLLFVLIIKETELCAKRANQNTWQCFVYPVPLIKAHAHQFKKIQCKISGVLYNKIFDFRFVFWSLVPDCITSFGKLVAFKPTAINHKSTTNKGNHTSNFTFPKRTQFYTKKGLSDQTREF